MLDGLVNHLLEMLAFAFKGNGCKEVVVRVGDEERHCLYKTWNLSRPIIYWKINPGNASLEDDWLKTGIYCIACRTNH